MVVTGIWLPLSICAERLFRAVTRGLAMVLLWPFDSERFRAAVICAVPKIPVVSWINPVGTASLARPVCPDDRAADVVDKRVAAEADLHADVTQEVSLRDNDTGFDLNLRFRLIEKGHQLTDRVDVLANVGDNDRVAAAVDFYRAAA